MVLRLTTSQEMKYGLILAVVALLSVSLMALGYNVLRGREIVLIYGPGDVVLLSLPYWLEIVLIIPLVAAIYGLHRRWTRILEAGVGDSIDTEFPLTSTAIAMSERVSRLNQAIGQLQFASFIFLGWGMLILPFYMLLGLLTLLSNFTDIIRVRGELLWGTWLTSLALYTLVTFFFSLILIIFRNSRELQHYVDKLQTLDKELYEG